MRRVLPIFLPRLRLCLLVLLFGVAAASLCMAALGGCDVSSAVAADDAVPQDQPAPLVRVLIISDAEQVKLDASNPPILSGEALGAVQLALPDRVPVSVTRVPEGWRIGDRSFPGGTLVLTPAEEGTLKVDRKRYRGTLRLVPRKGDPRKFDVVNDLDMESYLLGVLPSELPLWFHPTTYEAQAVVARTYALWEIKTAGAARGHYDVHTDDRSQVYDGMDAENENGRRGVQNTRGQVVVHETEAGPRIFKAYFHSTSGGATLGVESAFNEPAIKALSAQSLDDLSSASRFHEWDPVVLTKDEFSRRMKAWGERRGHPIKKLGRAHRLEIASTNEFGRPTRFEVIDTRGNRYSLIPEEMRWALNTDLATGDARVHSGYFKPVNNDTNIVISEGRGWGHGVGMCQFTADAWAKQGKDHVAIVTASYPGTSVVRAY